VDGACARAAKRPRRCSTATSWSRPEEAATRRPRAGARPSGRHIIRVHMPMCYTMGPWERPRGCGTEETNIGGGLLLKRRAFELERENNTVQSHRCHGAIDMLGIHKHHGQQPGHSLGATPPGTRRSRKAPPGIPTHTQRPPTSSSRDLRHGRQRPGQRRQGWLC
jgi:hypothetical protein